MTEQLDTNAELEKNPLEGNPYREDVEWLTANARNFNDVQLRHSINSNLVESIVQDAQAGKFTTKQPNAETGVMEVITLSVDDIFMGQFELALQAQDTTPQDDPRNWTKYIPRANGLRAAVGTIMTDKKLAEPFRMAVFERQADIIKQRDLGPDAVEQVSPEILELRTEAAEDLGEEAVEAADVAVSGVSEEASAARRMLGETPATVEHKEKDPFDYLREVLPPVVRPVTTPRAYSFNERHIPTAEEKQQEYYDKFVTEVNKQDALDTLGEVVKATPLIKEVLDKADISITSIEAVNAIRENPDVRFEVAKILLNKLNKLADDPDTDMGWRIINNSPRNLKNDPQTGKTYLSRVYAVNMALKMLGGEFSDQRSDSDFARDQTGKVINGQHRNAATQAMMSYYAQFCLLDK